MKTKFNKILWMLFLTSVIFAACEDKVFEQKALSKVNVGFNYEDGLLEAESSSFVKQSGFVSVPIEISLSDAASTLFNISLTANADTVNKLITDNVLINTMLMPSGQFNFPLNTEVKFGVKSVIINLSLSLSTLELNFGKKMAIGLDLVGASRGNSVNAFKKTVVVVIDSEKVLDENDVHSIKFTEGGERYNINASAGNLYTQSLTNFTIPIDITLVGSPGPAVSVQVEASRDTVLKMQTAGVLPANTVVLENSDLIIPTGNINILANQSNASFNLSIDPLKLAPHFGKNVALGLRLKNPSLFGLDPEFKTIVVIINTLVLNNITGIMKNMNRPYTFVRLDPRWGTPNDWIVNEAAKNHVYNGVNYGGWDQTNTCLVLGGVAGKPAITNGKIYQTITLPAGSYTYKTNSKDVINGGNGIFYFVVAVGDGIPNTNDVPTSALGYARPTKNDHTLEVNFTLTQETKVSIGFVATSTNGNFLVTVRSNQLLHNL